ncbi:hypothetical protein V6Z11_D06G173800 [Gossypium hirsutum]
MVLEKNFAWKLVYDLKKTSKLLRKIAFSRKKNELQRYSNKPNIIGLKIPNKSTLKFLLFSCSFAQIRLFGISFWVCDGFLFHLDFTCFSFAWVARIGWLVASFFKRLIIVCLMMALLIGNPR